MATIQEIAEKAGVSRGTVDRALNNRDVLILKWRKRSVKLLMNWDM